MRAPKVVVIGGGFGGLEVCRRLARANKRGLIELTLIAKDNFFQFNPLLPEVATGAVETRHIVYPLRDFCAPRGIRFLRNEVLAVDAERRVLKLRHDLEVPYDELVIAAGATSNFFGIPGAAEHSLVFKSLGDAVRLRAHVVEMWELADQATDAVTQRSLLTFVVAGGGITGVEVCSELLHMFRSTMVRLYPRVNPSFVNVHVVEAADRLLPGLKVVHSQVAERHLRGIGVNLVLNRKVVRVEDGRVHTDDGAVIPAHTLIWTTGIRGQSIEGGWPWPTGRAGRLRVDATCRVAPGVWAIGDVADLTDVEGKAVPQVAQGAIQTGRLVADNLLAALEGKPPRELRYHDYGYFVGLGKHSTVASVFGFPIAGWLAWYMWAFYYLVAMVGLRKQLEVLFDLVRGVFFEHDTSQIHDRRAVLREADLDPDLSGRAEARPREPA